MPYLGLQDGREVIPPQVPSGTTVQCPVCGDEMYVKRSHYRGDSFVSRHFVHKAENSGRGGGQGEGGGSSDCPGESDVHHKMKAIAYARLEEDFPNAEIELEGHLQGRFADVLLTFPEPQAPYGKGIAVEAQYQNKGKDIEGVTEHYFEHSYSVAWLEEDDFSTHNVDLSRILTLWPYAIPDRRGTEGYSGVIRWLWQDKRASVELEVPLPEEYWASKDKTGEWVTVAERDIKTMGSARISKSPNETLIFGLSKADWGNNESMGVRVYQGDVNKLRSFADELDRVAFGDERPSYEECDPEWHELSHRWLTGAPNVTAWIKAVIPSPNPSGDSDVVISLWRKKPTSGTEHVSMQIRPYATDNLRELADLLDKAFEIEKDR